MDKLGNICYGSGIFLIEKRDAVCFVKRNRQIKYRDALTILGFAILYEINIASLTILIRGVIGNIDPLFMVSSPVPVIKESDRLFSGNRREEPAYLGIAVYPHTFGKQWVAERKIRIILSSILFIDDQVRYQIHQQAAVFWEPPLQQFW